VCESTCVSNSHTFSTAFLLLAQALEAKVYLPPSTSTLRAGATHQGIFNVIGSPAAPLECMVIVTAIEVPTVGTGNPCLRVSNVLRVNIVLHRY